MLDISKVGRGSCPVGNHKIFSALQSITTKEILRNGDGNPTLREDFASVYLEWIKNCTVSPVLGLDEFSNIYFANGVTQVYDIFFYEHKDKRFRVLKGEYPYVQLSVNNWLYLEDDQIRENDAVVLSCPFYGNGGIPRHFNELLDQCLELKVPVMIDAAYFGTCYGVSFDYSHPAIEMVGFSLSKPLSIQSYRCGILFSKRSFGYLEEIQIQARYFNRVGAYVGMKLMQKFPADFMPSTYKLAHQDICRKMELLPTHCIMLANVKNEDKRFDKILEDKRFKKVELPENAYRRVCVSFYISDKDSSLKSFAKKLLRR